MKPETKPAQNKTRLVLKNTIQSQRAAYSQQLVIKEHELSLKREEITALEETVQQLKGAMQACDSMLTMPDYVEPQADVPAAKYYPAPMPGIKVAKDAENLAEKIVREEGERPPVANEEQKPTQPTK